VNALRSLLFKAIFYPGSAFYVLFAPVFALAGRAAVSRHVVRWARFHDWAAKMLLGIDWRVEGRIPQGAVLVAMKHESMYETIQALLFLDRPVPVMKRELMKIPVWGAATRLYGSIVVDREAGAKALRTMLGEARALIAEGRPILIFPEGTRVPHGESPELKAGISGLYRLLNLPVIPIACDSGRLMPRRGPRRSGTVTFKVGEPIPAGLAREEIEARVHAAINALN
jgi:1-acyl-sn-glycerol-3-phosphate acyltransferase